MHEYALACSIVELAEEAARTRRVQRVTLEIGDLSGVLADAITFCFEEVAKGTAVEGAVLDIRRIEGRARCRDCGETFETPAFYTPCACGSLDVERLQGEELNLKSLELEAA